jgi:hypothetical protein
MKLYVSPFTPLTFDSSLKGQILDRFEETCRLGLEGDGGRRGSKLKP